MTMWHTQLSSWMLCKTIHSFLSTLISMPKNMSYDYIISNIISIYDINIMSQCFQIITPKYIWIHSLSIFKKVDYSFMKTTNIVEIFKMLSAFCLNLNRRHMVWGLPKSYRQSRPLTPRKPVALLLHRSVFRKSDQVLEVVVDYLLLRKERHRKPKNPIRKLVYKWLNAKFCCHQKITSSPTE